jgi:hypothetical protein
LPAGRGNSACGAVQNADLTSTEKVAEILLRGTGGQVSKAVLVEVPGRHRPGEQVAGLDGAADLGEQRPPVVVSPPAAPYKTLIAPAPWMLLTSSSGALIARSAKPSWLKSPDATPEPNRSPCSGMLPTWVNSWLPVPLSPLAVP